MPTKQRAKAISIAGTPPVDPSIRIRQLETENARLRELIANDARGTRLLDAERALRSILDHMPSMVGYWGRDLRNHFGNHAYLDWFGVDPSTMPGKHIREVIGEERYRLNLPYIEAVLKGDRQQFERAILSPDGKTVRHSLADYVPDVSDGEVVGFFALVTDITAVKQAEEALRLSEARYRAVVEDQTEIISRFRTDGTFVFVNDVYCRFFGKTESELIGSQWMPACYSDDLPQVAEQLGALAPDNPVVVIENRVFDSEGRLRWMQFVNRAFFDASGCLTEIQSVGRDVTDRKTLETKLERSKQQLELALVASGLGTWDYDLRTGHVAVDANLQAMLGYSADELATYDSFVRLLHPEDRERAETAAFAHLRGDTRTYESEHRIRHKDGHFVWAFLSGRVVERDGHGEPLRMIGTIRNVSQSKRLADEGVNLMQRLETLFRDVTAVRPKGETSFSQSECAAVETLSRRQRQVLIMVAKGMSSPEIAKALSISTGTAIGHRRDLMRKLDLHGAADVTRFAIRNKLIDG